MDAQDELKIVLAEVALDEIEKSDNFQDVQTFIDLLNFFLLADILESAAQHGNSRLIILLTKFLTNTRYKFDYKLADILHVNFDTLPFSDVPLLFSAVKSGHIGFVMALLDAGADVDGPRDVSISPLTSLLTIALDNNHFEIARLLAEKGAFVGAHETLLLGGSP